MHKDKKKQPVLDMQCDEVTMKTQSITNKKPIKQKIPIIDLQEITSVIRNGMVDWGFSTVSGIIIVWDETYDKRILQILDEITDDEKKDLLLLVQSDKRVGIVWTKMPKRFKNDKLFLKKYDLLQYSWKNYPYLEFKN